MEQKHELFKNKTKTIILLQNYILLPRVKKDPKQYECNSQTNSVQGLKDRGGLQKPSPGLVSVCLTTEKCIQRRIRTNGGELPCGRGVTITMVNQVLGDCVDKDLFPHLHSHMFETCVEVNHIHVLVKNGLHVVLQSQI